MVDSEKSDNEESLVTGKRTREDHSGDDEKSEHPSKRPRSKSPETLDTVDTKKDVIVQVTNGTTLPFDDKEKTDSVIVKDEHKNGKDIATDDDAEINIKKEDSADLQMEVDEPVEKNKEEDEKAKEDDDRVEESKEVKKDVEEEEEKEESGPLKENKSKDSEVVDGLELSVECASDKEASSSESDKEKDTKPRPKTIIVKAKPNDSELEIGSSEAEKSEVDEKGSDKEKEREKEATSKKRVGKRKPVAKAESSRSEESLESNSDDEDYSPRTKKKLKKTATPKKAAPQKAKAKKARVEKKKKAATDSEDEKSESGDEELTLAERAKKISGKGIDKTEDKGKSHSDSADDADSANESDDQNKKNGKRRGGNNSKDPKDDKTIKMLRKYLTTAGIRVKFEDLWSGCKSNKQRADRIRKLLEESGIEGRPTLEKCKKLKAKNATQKEVAELDTSNIISEGRVTRARRTEANKSGTPPKQRDARNIFKRIQPVCDSDTE